MTSLDVCEEAPRTSWGGCRAGWSMACAVAVRSKSAVQGNGREAAESGPTALAALGAVARATHPGHNSQGTVMPAGFSKVMRPVRTDRV